MDNLTKKQRSYCMSHIKSTGTTPEVMFRKYLWHNGLKNYRIKNKLIGKPDVYFKKQKIAVFIDGCFWHGCPKCFIAPKSNSLFWKNKIDKNVKRDKQINKLLKTKGIKIIRFWEHEIRKNPAKCFKKIKIYYEKK